MSEGNHKGGRLQSRFVKVGLLSSTRFLTMLTTIAIYAVLSRVLSVDDYASYRQALLAYMVAAPFITLGLPQALYYFLPDEDQRALGVTFENLSLLVLMGSLFTLAILGGGNRLLADWFDNPDLAGHLLILAPYSVFMLPLLAVPACLMARDRVKGLAVFNLVRPLVLLAPVLVVGAVWKTTEAALIATVAGAAVIFPGAIWLMIDACKGSSGTPSLRGMQRQLSYSIPLGLSGMMAVVLLHVHKVVVAAVSPRADFAIYANGSMADPMVAVIVASVTSVLLPDFVRLYKTGDLEEIVRLWKTAIVRVASLLLPLMIFLFVMAPEIMRFLFSARYEAAAAPFRILLLMFVLRCMSTDVVLLAAGRSRLILFRTGVSLALNIVACIAFVNWFGMLGAPLSLVVVSYAWGVPVTLLLNARILKKKVRDIYPFLGMAKTLAVAVLAGSVFALKPFVPSFGDLFDLLLYTALYFPLALLLLQKTGLFNLAELKALLTKRKP